MLIQIDDATVFETSAIRSMKKLANGNLRVTWFNGVDYVDLTPAQGANDIWAKIIQAVEDQSE